MNGKEAADAFLAALDDNQTAVQGPLDVDRKLLPLEDGKDQAEVANDIELLERRLKLIVAARKSVQALLDNGFPEIPVEAVGNEVVADLEDQRRTLDAAIARFKPSTAAAKGTIEGLTTGQPRP